MSQHDYILDNQSGLNYRADHNDLNAAVATNNSGTTEPSTTYAYQWWADTTTGFLKIRNAANSAWVVVGTLASYNLGLRAPYSSPSDPSVSSITYAYFMWVDTSGSPKVLKIRNAANSAWTTIGPIETDNFGLLPTTGGVMSGPLTFSNTDYMKVPVGTTAQRPVSPSAGMIRFNTDLTAFETYNGTAWVRGGSGGAGGGIEWIEDDLPPVSMVANNMRLWKFEATLGQKLYTLFKVPSGYTAGQQINLKSLFYSPGSSGNVYFKTTTTLIRTATDAITSTTNQRTSSQGAVTLGAGTVNKAQGITCDLTDATGQINSVAVAAGDLLLIQFFRYDSDTATDEAYLFPEQSEVA